MFWFKNKNTIDLKAYWKNSDLDHLLNSTLTESTFTCKLSLDRLDETWSNFPQQFSDPLDPDGGEWEHIIDGDIYLEIANFRVEDNVPIIDFLKQVKVIITMLSQDKCKIHMSLLLGMNDFSHLKLAKLEDGNYKVESDLNDTRTIMSKIEIHNLLLKIYEFLQEGVCKYWGVHPSICT